MKNIRLVVILGIFVFFTLIIVLCSTVFTLNTVDLRWLSSTKVLTETTDSQIIDSADFDMGESVFLIDKEKYISNLEKNNPYLCVLGIEIKFPNRIKVSVSEREELYVLKVVNTTSATGFSFVYLDYDLKVLKITDTEVAISQENPPILTLENLNYTVNDFSAGSFTNLPVADMLISIGDMLSSTGYTNKLCKGLIKTVNVKFDVSTTIDILTTYGLNLRLLNAENNTSQKMLKALSIYEYYHNSHPHINDGNITVYERDGEVLAAGPSIS